MAVPKLRFKEFSGDYLELRYDEFAPLQRGFDLPVSTIVEGDYPVVFSNGILKKHNEFKAKAPGVVTGRSGTIGNITWVEKDYWPHNTSLWVTNFFENEPKYVFYFLQKFDVSRFASGSGVPTLNRNDVHVQLINIPIKKEEQTKIASFLSAVDEKISQLTQKHELLSRYKQGMMQKLFSQQIRFKADDGSEFGEWEETILSDIVDLFHGYQFRTSDFTSKGIAVIKIGNVIGNNLDLANLTYINENRLEDFKKFEIQNGDILMSLTGNIGRIIEVKNKPFSLLQNYRVGKFIPLNENFLIKPFLKYLLASDLVFGRFSQLANQSAQANFGKQDMDKITVFYPSVSEQNKIAHFLSAIDQKIEVVAQQIQQAKQWKKGLLQQMFV